MQNSSKAVQKVRWVTEFGHFNSEEIKCHDVIFNEANLLNATNKMSEMAIVANHLLKNNEHVKIYNPILFIKKVLQNREILDLEDKYELQAPFINQEIPIKLQQEDMERIVDNIDHWVRTST